MWKPIARTFATLASIATLSAALLASTASNAVTVVEYHNAALDAYFITGRTTEQALLDAAPSFRRTGMTFQATSGTDTSGAFTRICRFYVSLSNPYTSSHFYGKEGADCEGIRAQNVPGFTWEGYDFSVAKLNEDNTCPSGNTPLFRGFRAAANGKTPNHRYYPSRALCDAGAAQGYVCEGQVFCGGLGLAPPPGATVRTYRGTFSGGQQAIVFNGEVTWSLVDGELGPAGERIYKVTAANANIPSTFPGCSAPGAVQIDMATSVLGVDASNPGAVRYGGLFLSVPTMITCDKDSAPFGYIWFTCQTENNVIATQSSSSAARLQGTCNANDGASFTWDFRAVD